MSHLLDTDSLSNLMEPSPSIILARRLSQVPPDALFTSAITIGEIVFGAFRSARRDVILQRLQNELLPLVRVLPFDVDAAFIYGRLRQDLESQGRPLAEADLRIAAISLSRGLTLVTGNVRHFSRVAGLIVENWLE